MLLIIIIRTEHRQIIPQKILGFDTYSCCRLPVRGVSIWPILSMTFATDKSRLISCSWLAKRFKGANLCLVSPTWELPHFHLSKFHEVISQSNRMLWELTLGIGPSFFQRFHVLKQISSSLQACSAIDTDWWQLKFHLFFGRFAQQNFTRWISFIAGTEFALHVCCLSFSDF